MRHGCRFGQDAHRYLKRGLSSKIKSDRPSQPAKLLRCHAPTSQSLKAFGQAPPRPQNADIRRRRLQSNSQGVFVEFDVVSCNGDERPWVQADFSEGVRRTGSPVSHREPRRWRGWTQRSNQMRIVPQIDRKSRYGQSRRIATDHNHPLLRGNGQIDLKWRCRNCDPWVKMEIVGFNAVSSDAIGAPDRRSAKITELQPNADGGIVLSQRLYQKLDSRAAQKPDVRPRTAFPINQTPRLSILQSGATMSDDVRLDTSAGQKAGHEVRRHQHLCARRPWRSAIGGDQGHKGRSLGLCSGLAKTRPDIISQAEI